MNTSRTRRFSLARLLALLLVALSARTSAMAASPEKAPQTYYFLVFSNPVDGHETEYNQWYDGLHAADVVSIPGFVSAQRYVQNELPFFKVIDVKMPKYLIVYKIVSVGVESVFAEVERRLKTGETYISPAYDRKNSQSYVYRTLGAPLEGPGGDAPGAKSGPKQDYIQVVFSAMTQGADEKEFNAFYDQHHAREVVALPGFRRAQRMVLARPTTTSIQPTKYFALYWIKTSDPAALKKAATSAQGTFTSSPAFDAKATRGYTYRAIGPEWNGDRVRAERAKAHASK